MVEVAGAGATPLHGGLPDEINIWEILVRLPPKTLLRCRAVCRTWRRVTSTRDFLLAHHARQPALPILRCYNSLGGDSYSLDIIPLDLQAGTDQCSMSVTPLGNGYYHLKASCDGLLNLSNMRRQFSICNPATRQGARLPMLSGFTMLGMYMHSPTGEYQLLSSRLPYDDGCCVFTLGSGQPPRHIGGLAKKFILRVPVPVMFRGSLHWQLMNHGSTSDMIMVFSTTAESFRQMRTPVVFCGADLSEMDGMLSISSFNDVATTIDVWMMQDDESEVWALKYRVELLVEDLCVRFGKFVKYWNVVAASLYGEVFLLVKFEDKLLQIDTKGELVDSFDCKGLDVTRFRLRQTLVSHTFFSTLEGYVVNASPFI